MKTWPAPLGVGLEVSLRFGLGVGLALAFLVLAVTVTLGADPTPAAAEVLEGGDLRSEGEGPGLVGSPLLILAGVVALGLLTALVTVLIARLARHD